VSLAPLDRLEACHETLIGALDGNDIGAIEASLNEFREAVAEVRSAPGSGRADAGVIEQALRIARLAEAARVRVNFLTDMTSRRIEGIAALRGEAAGGYTRAGLRAV